MHQRLAAPRVYALHQQQGPQPPPPQKAPKGAPNARRFSTLAHASSVLSDADRQSIIAGLQTPPRQQQQQAPNNAPLSSQQGPGSTAQAEETVYVFSYGANMFQPRLQGITPLARDAAFVVDPNVRIVFKHRAGHATLESLPDGVSPRFCHTPAGERAPCVHGVLYRIPKHQLRQFKNNDAGYVLTQMDVETYDGLQVRANVFVSGPLSRLPQEVTPTEAYMRKLREGAAFNFLDPEYQAWLSSIETVPSAGLPQEYFNTPSRYISYSFLLISLAIVGGYLSQHL